MEKKFIHFGCWNQGYCDKDNKTPISKVMSRLEKTLKTKTKHDFVVIAGDNYYPNKPEKTEKTEKTEKKVKEGKTIIQANLESGFNCLPNDIEINIILGNHDLETSTKKKKIYIENATKEEGGDCLIMQLEKNIVSKRNKKDNKFSLDLYKHKWLGKNTLLLMIDTSMYDIDDAIAFLPCYNVKTGKEYKSIQELHHEQQDFVDRMIDQYNKRIENVIVIGHHPISGYKYKNEINNLIHSFPGLMELFLSIRLKLITKKINYYYLCADLHLYQIGTVTVKDTLNAQPIMSIKQYIVGTGGTKLDDSPFLKSELRLPDDTACLKSENLEAIYEMTPEQISLSTSEKYGFLECELYKSQMYFKFIDTDGKKYLEHDNIIRRNITRRSSSRSSRSKTLKNK